MVRVGLTRNMLLPRASAAGAILEASLMMTRILSNQDASLVTVAAGSRTRVRGPSLDCQPEPDSESVPPAAAGPEPAAGHALSGLWRLSCSELRAAAAGGELAPPPAARGRKENPVPPAGPSTVTGSPGFKLPSTSALSISDHCLNQLQVQVRAGDCDSKSAHLQVQAVAAT